jgi:hypothetical protein
MFGKLSRPLAGLFCVFTLLILGACEDITNPDAAKPVYRIGTGFTENGSVAADPASGVEGTAIALTVTANPGYRLKNGSLAYSDAAGETPIDETALSFLLPAAHITVTAEFEPLPRYTVSAGEMPGGVITAEPAGGPEETEISLTVRANPGYRLKSGSLAYSGPEGETPIDETTLKFLLPAADVILIAEFEEAPPGTYTASVGSLANGSIAVSPASGLAGTEITVTVNPEPGYRLKSGSLVYSGPAGETWIDETTLSFLLPGADVTVTAEFEETPPGTYTVSVGSLANGSIAAVPASGPEGTEISLTVTANPGYRIKSGSLAYSGPGGETPIDETTFKFLLPGADVTVTAEFEPIPIINYTASAGSLINGSIASSPASGPAGTEISLTVNPNPGYRLRSGSLKHSSVLGETPIDETTFKFLLPGADVTIAAEFELLPQGNYAVRFDNLVNGSIAADPASGPEGTEITLTVNPGLNYRLKSGTLKHNSALGEARIDETTLTFLLPAADITVTAEFERAAYTVTVGSLTNGSVTADPTSGPEGTEIALTVSPNPGYRLKSGSLTYGGSLGETPVDETTRKFLLPAADVTVAAEFEALQSYRVSVARTANGSITAAPADGYEGTEISLTVRANSGYRLKSGSLKYNDTAIDETTGKFLLPAANVRVSAEFEPDIYAVSIGGLSGGSIVAVPESGLPGTAITLTVSPDEDYSFKSGSLRYNSPAGDTPVDETTLTFSLPAAHVTVTAIFDAIPYTEISSPADLALIGATPAYPSDGRYILKNDITLSDWTPLCAAEAALPFSGKFNGNGKTITLQSFNNDAVQAGSYIGIFDCVEGSDEEKAFFRNVTIVSSVDAASEHDGGQSIGLLAGYANHAVFENITLQGSLKFSSLIGVVYLGGVAGWIERSVIKDCVSALDINVSGGYDLPLDLTIVIYNAVGGFAGYVRHFSTITNCHNTGGLYAVAPLPSPELVASRGGLIHLPQGFEGGGGTLNQAEHAQVFAGGIAGSGRYFRATEASCGDIISCTMAGDVFAEAGGWWAFAGGILGGGPVLIKFCTASGNLYSESDFAYVGGIRGGSGSTVWDDNGNHFTGTILPGDYYQVGN